MRKNTIRTLNVLKFTSGQSEVQITFDLLKCAALENLFVHRKIMPKRGRLLSTDRSGAETACEVLTMESLIGVISLCIACYSLGYVHGRHIYMLFFIGESGDENGGQNNRNKQSGETSGAAGFYLTGGRKIIRPELTEAEVQAKKKAWMDMSGKRC